MLNGGSGDDILDGGVTGVGFIPPGGTVVADEDLTDNWPFSSSPRDIVNGGPDDRPLTAPAASQRQAARLPRTADDVLANNRWPEFDAT